MSDENGPTPQTPHQVVQQPPDPLITDCAFLVYLDESGHWVADDKIERPIQVRRRASLNDFNHAAADIQKDITANDAANRTLMLQMQQAQQMAERLQTAKVAQEVGGPIGAGLPDLSKLRR